MKRCVPADAHDEVHRSDASNVGQFFWIVGAEWTECTPIASAVPVPPVIALPERVGVAAVPASSTTFTPYELVPAPPVIWSLLSTAPVLPVIVTAALVAALPPVIANPSRMVGLVTPTPNWTPSASWARMRVTQPAVRGQVAPVAW